jgi:hypothetical protein
MAITRKEFLTLSLGVTGAAMGGLLAGCGDDEENGDPVGECLTNGAHASAISGNHGHSLTITKEDIAAGAEKSYDIAGSAGHSHTVVLTASHFAQLATDTSSTVTTSETNGHTHSVTIACQ